ncbi:MAG: hypothetical protein R2824_34295 [Saprospiraceae bacterium]
MRWIWQTLFLFAFLTPGLNQAQIIIDSTLLNSPEVQILETQRGDVFFGFLKAYDRDSITFETQRALSIRIARRTIEWLGPVREAKWLQGGSSPYNIRQRLADNKYLVQFENLAYSFTAIPYPKGLAEYRNIDILFNTVDVGISDHLSIGGGMFVPLIFVLRGKLTFSVNDKLHLGVGTNGFIGLASITEGLVVHYFGMATLGDGRQYFNVTFGRVGSWIEPEESFNIATVGGSISFAERWRIYADIGLSPGETGILPSFVINWTVRRNRVGLGLLGIWDGFFEPIPLLSYAHRF